MATSCCQLLLLEEISKKNKRKKNWLRCGYGKETLQGLITLSFHNPSYKITTANVNT